MHPGPPHAQEYSSSLAAVEAGVAEGRLFSGSDFLDRLPGQLQLMLQTRAQAVVPLSGHSGGGKTTLAKAIAGWPDLPGQPMVLDADEFFAEERDPRHARVMDPNTHFMDWWAKIYDWHRLEDVLGELRAMGENGGVLNKRRVYKGGKFLTDDITVRQRVPEGKKVIVVPGHEVHLALLNAGYDDADLARAMVLRDPRLALEAALVRDVHDEKVRDYIEAARRLFFRTREYWLQDPIYRGVVADPRVQVVDNRDVHPDWNLIAAEDRAMLGAILQAWDAPRLDVLRRAAHAA